MDPDQHEGNLGYDDPLEAFTPDLVIQLARESNAILGAAGLPMIEAENVEAKISKLRWCPLAFEQLQDHLKDRQVLGNAWSPCSLLQALLVAREERGSDRKRKRQNSNQ